MNFLPSVCLLLEYYFYSKEYLGTSKEVEQLHGGIHESLSHFQAEVCLSSASPSSSSHSTATKLQSLG